MGTFVTGNTPLPPLKTDNPQYPPTGLSYEIDAVDINSLWAASGDLRDHVGSAWVNVKSSAYGAKGDGTTDDTAAIQAAFNAAVSANGRVLLPPGRYLVTSTLTLTGNRTAGTGLAVDIRGCSQGFNLGGSAGVQGTALVWGGSNAVGTVLMKVNGVGRFRMSDLLLEGSGTVETLFFATQNTPTTFSGYGWQFDNVNFESVRVNGRCFSIPDTTSDMARFVYTGCQFSGTTQDATGALGAAGIRCFYSSNQNSVNHTFRACSFQIADYGLYLDGGSFGLHGCEFTRNAVADMNFVVNSSSSAIKCWTEQSRQFVIGSNSTNVAALTVIDCKIASYPWQYWKLFESTRTQPANDQTQWHSVSWDRNGPLNLIGSLLLDPNNGAAAGAVAPTLSSTPTVVVPNGKTIPIDVNIIGSTSAIGTTVTSQFLWFGAGQATPRMAARKRVFSTTIGAATNVDIVSGSYWSILLTGSPALTLVTTHADPGDELTLLFTQNATGGSVPTFVNAKVAGTFTPTAAANAKSLIRFIFDGTTWNEVARSLNLA